MTTTIDTATLEDDALDAAVATIQDALGVTDGGFAALHFSGPAGDAIRAALRTYIAAELRELRRAAIGEG
jgi:hypothetical protein